MVLASSDQILQKQLLEELARLSDSVSRLGALVAQPTEPQSSVQIEQAAKPGQPPRITVKVYASMPELAADMAQQLYEALVARYGQAEARP